MYIFFSIWSTRVEVLHVVLVCQIYQLLKAITVQKMKFTIKDFFSKCDQIHIFLQILSYLLKKSFMENIFCGVYRSNKIQNIFEYPAKVL